ncbi:Serine/arginine repetitive matrix protein 1 [Frankliniella fusca]|uniref:Serine/arginine repetitive matrix protein 1 n=1 Tax=Frankliniella fusca TaxID=407009 RepID=A0AAE1LB83_9NEOP|nr:Serine/arginine repetitive matrix protein 1 [Frankliniella fusca]
MMYTGTTAEQDNRFSDKEKKLLKQMKFSDSLTKRVRKLCSQHFAIVLEYTALISFALQVDMSKVKLDSIKPWITKKLTEILKLEDDVVVEFVFNQLEAKIVC